MDAIIAVGVVDAVLMKNPDLLPAGDDNTPIALG
jgi:hypothetical protein